VRGLDAAKADHFVKLMASLVDGAKARHEGSDFVPEFVHFLGEGQGHFSQLPVWEVRLYFVRNV